MVVAALGPGAEGALAAKPVSYAVVLSQVRSVPLTRAVINPGPRHVEIKFHSGTEWEAVYPAGQKSALLGLLRARHVRVVFASPHKRKARAAVHGRLRLRYIAAGGLGALAVILGAALLLARRRRARSSIGS